MLRMRSYATHHRLPRALYEDLDERQIRALVLREAIAMFAPHGYRPMFWMSTEVTSERFVATLYDKGWTAFEPCSDDEATMVSLRVSWAIATADGQHGAWGDGWD